MEIDEINPIWVLFSAIIIIVIGLAVLQVSSLSIEQIDLQSKSGSSNSTYLNQITLGDGLGITTSTISVYNDTFLSCDGVNDYLLIYPHSNDTLSFWLNSTAPTSWVNIVNVMGTCYINSAQLPCPATYPVYWNGTAYFFCKTDATTFWAGQIDRIEVFDGQLTQTQVNTIWSTGR